MVTRPFPDLQAHGVNTTQGTTPFELWAGEAKIVTSQGVAGATAIEQFRVLAMDADGALVPWDGVTGQPVGFAAQPIPAGVWGPYYVGGFPNYKALVWPAGFTDDLAACKRAFAGTPITPGRILN